MWTLHMMVCYKPTLRLLALLSLAAGCYHLSFDWDSGTGSDTGQQPQGGFGPDAPGGYGGAGVMDAPTIPEDSLAASGGASGGGSGGAAGVGGSTTGSVSGPSGGSMADGGSGGGIVPTGGVVSSGGSIPPDGRGATGGATSTGGIASTGQGGDGTGGSGTGGSGTGGTGTGGTSVCGKGQVKPSQVVIMGDTFYGIAPQYIQNRIQDDARTAGSLGPTDTYRNVAVAGGTLNSVATTEWDNATQDGASVEDVIMNGGGNDCLAVAGTSGCTSCPDTFKTLLSNMAAAGVRDVIYTRYPEPGSPPGSNASLKACFDATMPIMQTVCEGATGLRCHWVDLRPVWEINDTTDGLHPTQSGGNHVGDAIWAEMVKDCIAQ